MLNPLLFWVVVDPSLSPFTLTIIITFSRRHLSHIQPFLLIPYLHRARTFLRFDSFNSAEWEHFLLYGFKCRVMSFLGASHHTPKGNLKKDIKKHRSKWTVLVECGNDLSSRQVTLQVLSARWSLTSVFGMRTGGSFRLLSPQWLYNL